MLAHPGRLLRLASGSDDETISTADRAIRYRSVAVRVMRFGATEGWIIARIEHVDSQARPRPSSASLLDASERSLWRKRHPLDRRRFDSESLGSFSEALLCFSIAATWVERGGRHFRHG